MTSYRSAPPRPARASATARTAGTVRAPQTPRGGQLGQRQHLRRRPAAGCDRHKVSPFTALAPGLDAERGLRGVTAVAVVLITQAVGLEL